MNYRRGLQRVYAVLTAAWVVAVLLAVIYKGWQPQALFNGGWEFADISLTEEFRMGWISIAAISSGPPILGYLLFFHVLPWIFRGFRSTQF